MRGSGYIYLWNFYGFSSPCLTVLKVCIAHVVPLLPVLLLLLLRFQKVIPLYFSFTLCSDCSYAFARDDCRDIARVALAALGHMPDSCRLAQRYRCRRWR